MLSPAHQKWVLLYTGEANFNARLATRLAGYSVRCCSGQAGRLLKRPDIQAEIERLQTDCVARLGLDREAILQQLKRVAFADPRDLINPDGSVKAVCDLSDSAAAAVAGLEVTEGEFGVRTKVKMSDRLQAMQMLMKHLGMLDERVEIDVSSMTSVQLIAYLERYDRGPA